MAQAKKKYQSKPGMKVGKVDADTLKIVNGETGEVKDTGRKVVVVDNTPGTSRHADNLKELEDLTEQVRRGASQIGTLFFEVGAALLQVQDKHLYRAGGFESFHKYLESVKEIRTRQTAYNMMAVAKSMTKSMAVRFGPAISYVIARATDDEARKELTRMASDGASSVELKQAAKKQREERGVEPKSPGRPPKAAIKRAVQVVGKNGVEKLEAPAEQVKASARARKRESIGVRAGETGLVQLVAETGKKNIKAGYTLSARTQLGEDGPDVKVLYNPKKKVLKYEVL